MILNISNFIQNKRKNYTKKIKKNWSEQHVIHACFSTMQSIFLSKSKSIRSIMRSKTKWKNPIKGASWTIKRRPPIFDGFDHSFHPKDTPPWLDYFCSNNLRFWGFVFWEYIAIKQICLFEKKTRFTYIYILNMECQFYSDKLVNNGSRQQVEFVDVIENRMSFRTK